MRSTAPSSGGEGSLLREPQHYEHHGSPNLPLQLKNFLRTWHHKMLDYQVPCHTPSFKTVFIKHAAVLDQLCNHKQTIADWSTSNPPICCCKVWTTYKSAALNPTGDHWVLSGSLLHSLLPPALAVIAEGSLSNKVFPSKKEYLTQLRSGLQSWTKRNGLPSMPTSSISELGHHLWSEHTQHITNHITKSSTWRAQRPNIFGRPKQIGFTNFHVEKPILGYAAASICLMAR